jgi:folate-binding protein YgfZ
MTVPLDEYSALRTGRGFAELAGWTSISITGSDRQPFLHSFSTNDIKRLRPGDSCEAFILNVKGKILGHVTVDCREDELALVTVPNQADAITPHLDRYVIREDVQLRDASGERAYLYVSARPTTEIPAARWIDWPMLGRVGSGLLESPTAELATVRTALTSSGYLQCGSEAFETLRIEAGTPLFGVDFNGENLPQEAARNERAISFTKGCYLGQETVARIDALGHVNQELRGVRFDAKELPAVGTALTHGGDPAGHVTSVTYSPGLKAPLVLAMIRRAFLAPGTALDSPLGACDVVQLPLAV